MIRIIVSFAIISTTVSAFVLRTAKDMTMSRNLTPMEQVARINRREPYGCYVENNFDFVGNDLKNVPGTIKDCCGACRNTNGCVAYTWSNHNGGTCWLKNYVDIIVVNTNTKSATLQYDYQSSCPIINEGLDYIGNDIGSAKAEKSEKCCDLCRNIPGCRAYTHTSHQGGTCWLKNGVNSRSYNPDAKSGLAYPPINPDFIKCEQIQANVDYEGGDILSVQGEKPESCCSQCRSNKGCVYYTWTNHNGGTCWLKNSAVAKVTRQGSYSGYGPIARCSFFSEINYNGHDIGNSPADDKNDCCEKCAAFDGCKFFSWSNYNGGTCWFKSAATELINTPGVWSAGLL